MDAVTSVWLIKRFLPNWQDANIAFVPAGETLNKEIADSDSHILHVDTGFGILDHHQSDAYTCAAKKTYEYLQQKINRDESWKDEAIERMVEVVNFYDHFREVTIADIMADYHVFDLVSIFDGIKSAYTDDNAKIINFGLEILDMVYKVMQERVWAEEVLEREGTEFVSNWGKAIAFETINDTVLKLAQKKGYILVVRKDPKKGYIRIKGNPLSKVDLTEKFKIFQKSDPHATWYLHPSKKLLLNGSTRNPNMKPTKLKLNQIIKILQK